MPIPTKEQLQEYEAACAQFTVAIADLNEEKLHYRPNEDEWSVHDIIIHMGDSETGCFWRIRKTLAEENSLLPIYDEVAWQKHLAYEKQDHAIALNLFTALRTSTAALLRSLPEEAWQKTSTHPERGELTLYDIFLIYLEHGQVHLEQINRLKQSLPTTHEQDATR